MATPTATELADAVRGRHVAPLELAATALSRAASGSAGNAFITISADRAFHRAARDPRGRLAGVPVAVKDSFDTAGVRTTYGSALLADHIPPRSAGGGRR